MVAALLTLTVVLNVTGCEGAAAPARGAAHPSFLLVSLPALGTATWRCGTHEDEYGLGFRVFPSAATTGLRLIEEKRIARQVALQPGEAVALPLLGLSQRLELKQFTGAGTLRASVAVRFDDSPVVSHCLAYSPPHLTVRVTPRR